MSKHKISHLLYKFPIKYTLNSFNMKWPWWKTIRQHQDQTFLSNEALSDCASSDKRRASSVVSFHWFNWAIVISASFDKRELITWYSALMSFCPASYSLLAKFTLRNQYTNIFKLISDKPEFWIASSALISSSFFSVMHLCKRCSSSSTFDS